MLLRMIYDDRLAQAAYLIGCSKTGEAIIIDPARDVDRFMQLVKSHGLTITAVAETHIHADFLSGARQLAEEVGARLYLSDEGRPDWSYNWLDKKLGGGHYDAVLLKDSDTFTVGNIEFQAVHTPGHTPEHMSFLVTDRGSGATEPIGIATGDFVFVGDLGRPDLLETAAGQVGVKQDAARTLYASTKKFGVLPEFLQVWPAHGAGSACGKALGAVPTSTVGYEKRYNVSLAHADSEAGFVEFILAGQPAPPLYFARMKQQNRDGVPLLEALPAPAHLSALDLQGIDASKVVVVDTRPWAAFRDGHLHGSLWGPPGVQFAMVAGSYIEPDQQIVLIADEKLVEELTRVLVRIGLDKVIGFATAADMAQVDSTSLDRVPEITAVAFLRGDVDACVLDVRGEHEHRAGALEGSLNIPHTRLKPQLDSLPRDKPIVAHCKGGMRSAAATAFLRRQGFDVINLAGGYMALEKEGAPIVKGQTQAV